MAKKRTQNKFLNSIISCMRTAFARYSPKYEEVIKGARVEKEKINKDGSVSKRPAVWYTCNSCNNLTKKVDIDHIEPIIEPGKTYKDYTLDEILARLDCSVDNLQVLCQDCHKEKTTEERKRRRKK